MVEILEYSLVILVSIAFVVGSVAAYGGFTSFESGVALRAEFASVSSLAQGAIQDGASRGTLSLPDSTISCRGGSLVVSSGSASQQTDVGVPCSFSVHVADGSHSLSFSEDRLGLSLAVT